MKTAVTVIRIVVQPLAIGLIAALVVRATLLQAYSIPSASMSPSLEPGDHILVTPLFPSIGRDVDDLLAEVGGADLDGDHLECDVARRDEDDETDDAAELAFASLTAMTRHGSPSEWTLD